MCRLDVSFAHQVCLDKNVRLLAVDRPGIGLSARQANRTLLDCAADMGSLMAALGIDSAALLGWSVGGPFAFATAYGLGSKISKVATVGCAPPLDYPNAKKELGLWLDRLLLTMPPSLNGLVSSYLSLTAYAPPALLKFLMITEILSEADRRVVRAMSVKEVSDMMVESVRQGGDGNLDDYAAYGGPWGFSLADIKQEVQLWYGDNDLLVPQKAQAYMTALIPKATEIVASGEGHFLHHVKMAEILDWLVN